MVITTANTPKALWGVPSAPAKPARKHKGSKAARKAARKGKGKAAAERR